MSILELATEEQLAWVRPLLWTAEKEERMLAKCGACFYVYKKFSEGFKIQYKPKEFFAENIVLVGFVKKLISEGLFVAPTVDALNCISYVTKDVRNDGELEFYDTYEEAVLGAVDEALARLAQES